MADLPPLGLAELESARDLLRAVVRCTPLEHSRVLAERLGGPVYLKCENLQRTGSFKIRGAYTRIARLAATDGALGPAGIVAASAGNHAQGVALAAQLLNLPATVMMPVGAALPKVAATRGYGATVELVGGTVESALEAAEQFAQSTGAVLVHPFDHLDVIAGQGSVGLEILDQCPDVATVLVAAGGGGLLAGIAAAVAARRPTSGPPTVRVIGVQAATAAAYPLSLAAGHPITLTGLATMADGIAVARPGDVPFELIRRYVSDVVTVSEEAISRALLLLLERAKLVVEPAGAVTVAALLDRRIVETLRPPVVAVLSGGNIDPLLQLRVIRHGLAAAGRYLNLRVQVPDHPGSLATLLGLLAQQGANVLEVDHTREGTWIGVDEAEVGLRLELRDRDHRQRVLAAIEQAGYRLVSDR